MVIHTTIQTQIEPGNGKPINERDLLSCHYYNTQINIKKGTLQTVQCTEAVVHRCFAEQLF